MTKSTVTATPPSGPRPMRGPHLSDEVPATGARKWILRCLAVLAASSTLVWIGAIAWGTFGDPKIAGVLEDRRFPPLAEPICKEAMDKVLAFPEAHEAASPTERAGVIRQSTAIVQTMQADLRTVVPEGPETRYINEWIDDWSIHINDRLDFADRLDAKGAGEEFFETTKADTQISKSLNNFAEVNNMGSCQTPGDV